MDAEPGEGSLYTPARRISPQKPGTLPYPARSFPLALPPGQGSATSSTRVWILVGDPSPRLASALALALAVGVNRPVQPLFVCARRARRAVRYPGTGAWLSRPKENWKGDGSSGSTVSDGAVRKFGRRTRLETLYRVSLVQCHSRRASPRWGTFGISSRGPKVRWAA